MHTIITQAQEPAARWSEALGQVALYPSIKGLRITPETIYWMDFSTLDPEEARNIIDRIIAIDETVPVVCMVPYPRDEEAFGLLARGARGYCHVAAASSQLRLVATTVTNGGFWLPTTLMRRFMSNMRGISAQRAGTPALSLEDLTHRERQVAQAVTEGLSNREIAERLSLSERAVKARLTSVFQKLEVRDRVQLALLLRASHAG